MEQNAPLQDCIRDATNRGEEMQRFQLYPIIEQRDAQENLLRIHTPVLFMLPKELKTELSMAQWPHLPKCY